MKEFQLPALPYAADALEPSISRLTLRTHHGKHHKTYIEHLNEAVRGTPKALWSLERIVREASGAVFNNAAQAWNHEFYWHSLHPEHDPAPRGGLRVAISRSFGGLPALRRAFDAAATEHFGSGWAWLVSRRDGRLAVLTTHDADTPLRTGALPLLTCDLWEHAYYLDRKNDRAAYLRAFWQVVNWSFAEENLERGTPYVSAASGASTAAATASSR